jgi:hypothetical protein
MRIASMSCRRVDGARKVNEDAAHDLRGNAEEVGAILPAHAFQSISGRKLR